MSNDLIPPGVEQAIAAGSGAGASFFVVRWFVQWVTGRHDRRQAALDEEHQALDMSWKDYRLHLEKRMQTMERQNRALRLSFEHVAGALIRNDPENAALAIADRIMAQAFPDDFSMTVTRLDQAGESRG